MRVRVLRRCGTSSNHVALLLSSLYLHPSVHRRAVRVPSRPSRPSSCASISRRFPSPRAAAEREPFPRSARGTSKDYAFTSDVGVDVDGPSSGTPSQRCNQRRVTRGNGRKEEGSDRHFQVRSTKRRQKLGPAIIPESGRPATVVSWMSFNRYVSRVLS